MATSMFVNVRTTKLNDFNRFTVTFHENGTIRHATLFDFKLTAEEMDELENLVMGFAGRIFESRHPEAPSG